MDGNLESIVFSELNEWLNERNATYESLLQPQISFDFDKKIIFHSLPSYIVNQHLCVGQPIFPLNCQLKSEYEKLYSDFKKNHNGCFRCLTKIKYVELFPDNRYLSEEKICYLPSWIELQFLFENEPIRPPDNVEDFFTFYILGNFFETNKEIILENFRNFSEKERVISYFNSLNEEYVEQHTLWCENLSLFKRQRFNVYCKSRNPDSEVKKRSYKRKTPF